MAQNRSAKKEALELIEKMPPRSSWDDIMYEIYLRQKIEIGIAAAAEERVIAHESVKRRFVRSK